MSPWVLSALSNVALAAALGVLAWAVARWSRRPAVAHALYLLALVKLVTPPLLGIPVLPGEALSTGAILPDPLPAGVTAAGSSSTPVPMPFPWLDAALLSWIAGALACALHALVRIARLDRCVVALPLASVVVQSECRRLARHLGLQRAPDVRVLEAAVSPMVCPTRRGLCVVLPARMLATLRQPAREAMLAHELVHIRRRDHLARFLELAVVVAWWWLPLVYALRRGLRRVEELCCDAAVVASLDTPDPYAETLIATAGLLAGGAAPAPAHVCGLGPVDQLEERLQNMRERRMDTRRGVPGRLLCAAALTVLPFSACGAPAVVAAASRPPPLAPAQGAGAHAFLTGWIDGPSRLDVSSGDKTLLDAVTQARPRSTADLTRVALIRVQSGAPMTREVDVREMISTGNTSYNVLLAPGDIVYIPTSGQREALIDKPSIGMGDRVVCLIAPAVLKMPGAERLELLTRFQQVGADGTILVPYVGSVKVLGLTTKEATTLLSKQLGALFSADLQLQVRACPPLEGR